MQVNGTRFRAIVTKFEAKLWEFWVMVTLEVNWESWLRYLFYGGDD